MHHQTVPTAPDVDTAFGHWLAGFIDGEGHFNIGRQKRNGYYGYQLQFQMKVRLDDREVIEEIHRRTGIGWLCFPKRREAGNTRPQVGWGVSSLTDCLALVALIDRFPLRAKKQRDYTIWREAVLYRERTSMYGGQAAADWSELERLWRALTEVRRFTI